MKLYYENEDITNGVDILLATIEDNAGEVADSMDISISDVDKNWRSWNVELESLVELADGEFSSGKMYIDSVFISRGKCTLKAIPIKRYQKDMQTKVYENISLLNLAKGIAISLNLTLETYGVTDYIYERLDQYNKTSIKLLIDRCMLEGYRLKITNNKLVIYSEELFEKISPSVVVSEEDFIGNYDFSKRSSKSYGSCIISYFGNKGLVTGSYKINEGAILRPSIRVSSIQEAERYSKNILRASNKNKVTSMFNIGLNLNLAGGSTILISDVGSFSGKYFIEQAKHNFTKKITTISARRVNND